MSLFSRCLVAKRLLTPLCSASINSSNVTRRFSSILLCQKNAFLNSGVVSVSNSRINSAMCAAARREELSPLFAQITRRGAKTRVNKSAKKRFRVTANAGLKAGHAGRRHLNRSKTRKVLNNMRKDMHLSGANLRNMRRLLQMPNR